MFACCNKPRKQQPTPGVEEVPLRSHPPTKAQQYGVKELYSPDGAIVDIIFVHGLGGHREQTWTAHGRTESWPASLLPRRCPEARILTYGYDSRGTDWHMVSHNRINNHAKNLLHAIVNHRSEDETNHRPILFVVHSLGGLVAEDALLASDRSAESHLHSIVDCTQGIVFLGTPHAGSSLASWAQKLTQVINTVKQANPSMCQVLRTDSEVLARIQADFYAMIRTKNRGSKDVIKIICFYEELPVAGLGMIVPLESAILPGYSSIGIHQNHMDMSRCPSEDDQGFIDITAELRRWVHELSKIKLLSSGSKPRVFFVPFERSKNFVGRTHVFADISARFEKSSRISIVGIGGIGKSQIALEWCYLFKDQNPSGNVFWVYANSVVRFQESYANIARRFKIPGWDDPKVDVLSLVSEWMNSDLEGEFFMVLDNADSREVLCNPEVVALHREHAMNQSLLAYLPKFTAGKLLITTRNEKLGRMLANDSPPMVIDSLTNEEGMSLLKNETSGVEWDRESAETIVETLHGLPLAITQAAAYVQNNKISPAKYCELLAENDESLADMLEMDEGDVRRDINSVNSVLRTWQLSFEYIKQVDSRAAELLSTMSILDISGIPRTILRKTGESQGMLISSLGTLQAFGLITAQYGHDTYSLHRLVKVCTQRWIKRDGNREEINVMALDSILSCFPRAEPSNWEICRQLFSHAMCLQDISFAATKDRLSQSQLHFLMARYEWQRGRYTSAEILVSKAQTIQEKQLQPRDFILLDTLQLSADIKYDLNRFKESLEIIDKVLAMRENENDRIVDLPRMVALSTRAGALAELGSLHEAESIYREVLSSRTKLLGDDHVDTVATKAALALVLRKRGNFRAACELSKEAVDQNTRALGVNHYETLACMAIWSASLRRDGQYAKAAEVGEQVLAGRKATLGSTHIRTLNSLGDLAIIYRYMGLLEKAEPMFREAHAGYIISSPHELWADDAAMELAVVLRERGKFEEAITIMRQCLETRQEKLPPGHPFTLYTLSSLAALLDLNGQYEQAEPYILQAIAERTKGLGKDSPDTLFSRYNYAVILQHKGDLKASEEEWRAVLTATRKAYGRDDHPHELSRSAAFAIFLADQERYEEAHKLMSYVVSGYKAKPEDLFQKKATENAEIQAKWPPLAT